MSKNLNYSTSAELNDRKWRDKKKVIYVTLRKSLFVFILIQSKQNKGNTFKQTN